MSRPQLAVLGLLLLVACQERAAPTAETAALYKSGEVGYALTARGDAQARVAAARPAAPPDETVHFDRANIAPDLVIRNGQVSISVDSLEPAIAAVHRLAEQLGGYLANTTLQTGDRRLRTASLEVRIPSARFDDAVGGLQPIGTVESVNVTAQDVGEEFVDVTARMENARRLEQRLIDILANRTGKLADILEIEQTIARVREEIERYAGRLRYLRAHAAVSSLVITVHEPGPLVGERGTPSVLGEAFAQAWRNFVHLAALVIASLGVVLPLGLAAAAVWYVVKRHRQAPVAPPAAL